MCGSGNRSQRAAELLAEKGYNCSSEFSRSIIEEFKRMGENSPFKSQPIAFSQKIWQKRKQQYQNPKFLGIGGTKPFVFFDMPSICLLYTSDAADE